MTPVKIKVEFEVENKENINIREAINSKFSNKVIDFPTVPQIGEWLDLVDLSENYDLSEEESTWLAGGEHRYQIENVNKCDGYIEVELDIDKVWPEEAKD